MATGKSANAVCNLEPGTRAGAGWKFDYNTQSWNFVEAEITGPCPLLNRPLRVATLNVLHDLHLPAVLHHDKRYDAIFDELQSLDADVIGLNEVSGKCLGRILAEPWVQRNYTVSAITNDPHCANLSTLRTFGNVLLSKLPPSAVHHINQSDTKGTGRGRETHVMSFDVRRSCKNDGNDEDSQPPLRLAVSSVHLKAFPYINEGLRKQQLQEITSTLAAAKFDLCILMGDHNFHREAENDSIPEGWQEIHSVVSLGMTWDYVRNKMIPHYLPWRNMYNGFGFNHDWGWQGGKMRLDRVLVHAPAKLDNDVTLKATARLFADLPVVRKHQQTKSKTTGTFETETIHPNNNRINLDSSEYRSLSWQDYLFPSDHFGIFVQLPLK